VLEDIKGYKMVCELKEGDVIVMKIDPNKKATISKRDGVVGFASPVSGIWRPLRAYNLALWRKV
jgi:hypothetical protein